MTPSAAAPDPSDNETTNRTPSGSPRARALGIAFDGTPARFNAITDVPGLEIGYCTLIRGDGPLVVGRGPVRTGVTAILPRGREDARVAVHAGVHVLNGNGEMTGSILIEECGHFDGPITITNTHSCGTARDASIRWMLERAGGLPDCFILPVAAETCDCRLNDMNGFHVREEHVFQALDSAAPGPIEEGSVGGGTGMICYGYKGGSGTSSRLVEMNAGTFTIGVFVQANFGRRERLVISGVPVGRHLPADPNPLSGDGSIIGILATDAPLLPHQLKRLARRMALGMSRSGSIGRHSSGDIFLAFSTANPGSFSEAESLPELRHIRDTDLNPLFASALQATDEAILNSLVANQRMVGINGYTVEALPHQEVVELLARYRTQQPAGKRSS